ncbi:MAG: YceI family protein [Acidobacteriia bacterium]|nr:YceI family protein [Terriglobia bacterium]
MNIRKLHFAFAAAIAALFSLGAAAAPNSWQIDPQHSAAQFSVRHMGIATVRGEFHNVQGTVLLDESDITKSSVSVTMDAASVDTREPARDKHLRSADFFDVEKYPAITFQSTRVEQSAPGKLKITGDLTIHGVSKSVVLEADVPAAAIKDPWGNLRTAASATTKINRQDFGVKWNGKMDNGGWVVSDEVSITLDIEMIRKPAPEPAK